MGRKRTRNKNLPDYLYYRPERKKKPYRLFKPDGTSVSFPDLDSALDMWAYHWGASESTRIGDLLDTLGINVRRVVICILNKALHRPLARPLSACPLCQ